ncbi:hypothetical protein HYS50_03725 [Candidatus Woesearchaeota archaeon]|nr:hypothetical protein [Candidatus Woesearchaeota archaeon]
MKKIFTILVLVAFLLSTLSVAYADYGKSRDSQDVKKGQETGIKKQLSLEEKQERLNKNKESDDDDDEDEDEREDDDTDDSKQRQRGKVKERLEKAKERKKDISDAAKELKEKCRAKQTLEGNCGVAFDKIKEHLNKVVDRMIEALGALKNRVTPVPPVDVIATTDVTDVAATTVAPIDDWLTRLQTLKTEIAAAKTRPELKAVMRKVSATWVEFKQFFHKKQDEVHSGRARSLLAKAEAVHEKLDLLLERLKTSGGSQAQLQAVEDALKAVDAQVEVVKQDLEQGDKDVVKESLKKLHGLLKDVVHRFRQIGKGKDVASVVKVTDVAPVAAEEEVVA